MKLPDTLTLVLTHITTDLLPAKSATVTKLSCCHASMLYCVHDALKGLLLLKVESVPFVTQPSLAMVQIIPNYVE